VLAVPSRDRSCRRPAPGSGICPCTDRRSCRRRRRRRSSGLHAISAPRPRSSRRRWPGPPSVWDGRSVASWPVHRSVVRSIGRYAVCDAPATPCVRSGRAATHTRSTRGSASPHQDGSSWIVRGPMRRRTARPCRRRSAALRTGPANRRSHWSRSTRGGASRRGRRPAGRAPPRARVAGGAQVRLEPRAGCATAGADPREHPASRSRCGCRRRPSVRAGPCSTARRWQQRQVGGARDGSVVELGAQRSASQLLEVPREQRDRRAVRRQVVEELAGSRSSSWYSSDSAGIARSARRPRGTVRASRDRVGHSSTCVAPARLSRRAHGRRPVVSS
jgi:hypothetical protein